MIVPYSKRELDLWTLIEKNIADEAEARVGYYNILKYSDFLTEEEVSIVEEIISEELKHTELLKQFLFKRNFIKPEK